MKRFLTFLFRFFTDHKFIYILAAFIFIGGISLIILDRYVMPAYTLHGQGITVPEVSRMPLEEAIETLQSRGLRHEMAIKRSNIAYPPDYVIDQNPMAGMIVKPGRKVYLTINTTTVPTVLVPELEHLSLRNATIQIQNSGLQVGNITYRSSRFRNSVLRQSIPAGRKVDQNTAIDLVVGDGLGSDRVNIPSIKGLHLTEAQNKLRQAGLRIGSIRFEPSQEVVPNTVLNHDPDHQRPVFEGTAINLVVSVSPAEEEEEEAAPVIIEESEEEPERRIFR